MPNNEYFSRNGVSLAVQLIFDSWRLKKAVYFS